MIVPWQIEQIINKRNKLASELIAVECELDKWIEEHGGSLMDDDISDSVLYGYLIYTEPEVAAEKVKKYIRDKL